MGGRQLTLARPPRAPSQDPETTGYFKHTVSGDEQEIAFFATAPKKWCIKFATTGAANGVWTCTTDGGAGEFTKTATVLDVVPAPSKFGAGGLPKGQVNLGEQEEGWEDVRAGRGRGPCARDGGTGGLTPCPTRTPPNTDRRRGRERGAVARVRRPHNRAIGVA